MKRLVEHVKKHRKIVHAHLKKHHKKYLFGVLSAALLIKIIPAFIAGIATWHFNYLFADASIAPEAWELGCRTDTEGECNSDFGTYDVEISEDAKTITFSNIELQYPNDDKPRPDPHAGYYGVKIIAPEADTEHNSTIKIGSHDYVMNDENKEGVTENGRYFLYYWPHVTADEAKIALEDNEGIIRITVPATLSEVETILTINIDVNNLTYVSGIDGDTDFKVIDGEVVIFNGEDVESGGSTETGYTITYTDGVEDEEVFADQITTGLSLGDDIPGFDGTPTRTGYTFSGWNPEVTGNVSGNQTYTAQWNAEGDDTGDNTGDDTGDDGGNGSGTTLSGMCDSGAIIITSPASGSYYKLGDIDLRWGLNGSGCEDETFTIKILSGTEYVQLATGISANSGLFHYSGLVESGTELSTKFRILNLSGELVAESSEFHIDNINPTIVSATYRFVPTRTGTFGLNDHIYLYFTGSEELTGISVNVIGNTASIISKSELFYTYGTDTQRSNTGRFGYNISFRDLAGNTGYYEYFDSGLTLDSSLPEISGNEILFTIDDNIASVAFRVTKKSDITFTYVLSGGRANEKLTNTSSTIFRDTLQYAKVDTSNKKYKYTIKLKDYNGNEKYYAGVFYASGNTIINSIATASGDTISNNSGTSIIGLLKNEISSISGCKNNKITTSVVTKSIKKGTRTYDMSVEIPNFRSKSLQDKAENLVLLLLGNDVGLGKSSITGLTVAGVNNFNTDLNNYLLALKVVKEPETCNTKFSMLPNLYMSAFLKTLKSYGLIK